MRLLGCLLFLLSFNVFSTSLFNQTKNILIEAGELSNTNPVDLTTIAAIESSFKTNVKSKTSSARGLFQFTKRTWRVTVNSYKHKYQVKDWDIENPLHNTLMGAEYLNENKRILEKRLKRKVTLTDTYLAHLLAPRRVVEMNLLSQSILMSDLYPKLAKYNTALFYQPDGRSRTISEFKQLIKNKINKAKSRFGILIVEELTLRKEKQNRIVFENHLRTLSSWWICQEKELIRKSKGEIKELTLTMTDLSDSSFKVPHSKLESSLPYPSKEVIFTTIEFYDRRIAV